MPEFDGTQLYGVANEYVLRADEFATTSDGVLGSFDRRDGHAVWSVDRKGSATTVAACGGKVFFDNPAHINEDDWAVLAVDAFSGEVAWSLPVAGAEDTLSLEDDRGGCTPTDLIFETWDGLRAYSLQDGTLTWAIDNSSVNDLVRAWHVVDGELFLSGGDTLSLWR